MKIQDHVHHNTINKTELNPLVNRFSFERERGGNFHHKNDSQFTNFFFMKIHSRFDSSSMNHERRQLINISYWEDANGLNGKAFDDIIFFCFGSYHYLYLQILSQSKKKNIDTKHTYLDIWSILVSGWINSGKSNERLTFLGKIFPLDFRMGKLKNGFVLICQRLRILG